jgi:hypothetical protein
VGLQVNSVVGLQVYSVVGLQVYSVVGLLQTIKNKGVMVTLWMRFRALSFCGKGCCAQGPEALKRE